MHRALINVDTVDKQLYIFKEIKEKGLSVRQTEELVRKLYKFSSSAGEIKKMSKSKLPPTLQKIEDNLASHFSTRVKLKHKRNGGGHISFDYYSPEELNKLLRQWNVSIE